MGKVDRQLENYGMRKSSTIHGDCEICGHGLLCQQRLLRAPGSEEHPRFCPMSRAGGGEGHDTQVAQSWFSVLLSSLPDKQPHSLMNRSSRFASFPGPLPSPRVNPSVQLYAVDSDSVKYPRSHMPHIPITFPRSLGPRWEPSRGHTAKEEWEGEGDPCSPQG